MLLRDGHVLNGLTSSANTSRVYMNPHSDAESLPYIIKIWGYRT